MHYQRLSQNWHWQRVQCQLQNALCLQLHIFVSILLFCIHCNMNAWWILCWKICFSVYSTNSQQKATFCTSCIPCTLVFLFDLGPQDNNKMVISGHVLFSLPRLTLHTLCCKSSFKQQWKIMLQCCKHCIDKHPMLEEYTT